MSAVVERRKAKKKRDFFHGDLIPTLTRLEQDAHNAQLRTIARRINECKNAVGWAMAEGAP